MFRVFPALLAATGLAACGGGGVPPTYAEYQTTGLALAERLQSEGTTLPIDLPTTGNAAYEGLVLLEVQGGLLDQHTLAGEMSMNVDFSDDSVTGGATRFVDDLDYVYSGALAVNTGELERDVISGAGDGSLLAGNVIGNLEGTLVQDQVGTVVVDAAFMAWVTGENAEFLSGSVSGDFTLNGDFSRTEGAFILEAE